MCMSARNTERAGMKRNPLRSGTKSLADELTELRGLDPAALQQEAATALSSIQQSAAKSALCSAIASKFPNPAAAGPSALSDPGVLSTAASSFAGSAHLPLPSATDMIKAYAMQHATDILGSCA